MLWCVVCGSVGVWECGSGGGVVRRPSTLPQVASLALRAALLDSLFASLTCTLTACEKPRSRRQVRSDAVLPSPLYGYVLEQPRSQVGVVILWQGWASESGKAREQKRGRAES